MGALDWYDYTLLHHHQYPNCYRKRSIALWKATDISWWMRWWAYRFDGSSVIRKWNDVRLFSAKILINSIENCTFLPQNSGWRFRLLQNCFHVVCTAGIACDLDEWNSNLDSYWRSRSQSIECKSTFAMHQTPTAKEISPRGTTNTFGKDEGRTEPNAGSKWNWNAIKFGKWLKVQNKFGAFWSFKLRLWLTCFLSAALWPVSTHVSARNIH